MKNQLRNTEYNSEMWEDGYRGKASQTVNFAKTKREVGSKGAGGDPLKIREPKQFLKVGIKKFLQVNKTGRTYDELTSQNKTT